MMSMSRIYVPISCGKLTFLSSMFLKISQEPSFQPTDFEGCHQVERITAEPRAQLEEKLKEVEEMLDGGGWDGGSSVLGRAVIGVGVVVVIIDDD